MWGERWAVVPDNQRALLFRKKGRFERVLTPGTHWIWDPLGRREIWSVEHPRISGETARGLLERMGDAAADELFLVVETDEDEIAFIGDGRADLYLQPPARFVLYWLDSMHLLAQFEHKSASLFWRPAGEWKNWN